MKNRRIIPLAVLALLLAAGLACQALQPMSAGEKFLQGTWTHAADQGEGRSSYLEWTFDAGRFSVEGYPPLAQTGTYRVTAENGDTLTLALTDQVGDWPTEDRDLTVVINAADGTLRIDGQEPFTRVTP